MKIPRSLLGKLVEIQWMDPCFNTRPIKDSPVGRAALATWLERGKIIDITDGIIQVEHSHETHAESTAPDGDEHSYTPIPEALIERYQVLTPSEWIIA